MNQHHRRPRQAALRENRCSLPGHWYAITKCTAGRRPLLVPDSTAPDMGARGARIVVDAIRWMHAQGRLRCRGYVIMPDHFHLLMELGAGHTLASCMQMLCGFTAREIAVALGVEPPIWQSGYHDHAIRGERQLLAQWTYIRNNPVRKGLVGDSKQWPYLALQPAWDTPP